jgi:hypothetical protein
VVIPATAAEDWAGDWNDLSAQAGRETVRAQIVAQLDGQRDALEARARTAAGRVSRALGLLGGGVLLGALGLGAGSVEWLQRRKRQ